MASDSDIPPTDAEVIAALGSEAFAPNDLVSALEQQTGHSSSACRQAVRRCLNRGSIRLSDAFLLEVTPSPEKMAA